MAVGADMRLSAAPRPSMPMAPAAPKQKQPKPRGFAPMVNDNAVSDMANNRLAEAVGAGRAARSEIDRAGISRGRGHQHVFDMGEAAADAEARGEVAKMEQGVAKQNAAARQAYDNTMANESIQSQGLLEGLRSSAASERLARQGLSQNTYEAMRRGQFGLDSIQLDYSPLLARLMN